MNEILILALIPLFLIVWSVATILTLNINEPYAACAYSRLQADLSKYEVYARNIAVWIVTCAFLFILALSVFVDTRYSSVLFVNNELPLNSEIGVLTAVFGILALSSNTISNKALSILSSQKGNLSFYLINRAKRFNMISNLFVITMGVCLALQVLYRALGI